MDKKPYQRLENIDAPLPLLITLVNRYADLTTAIEWRYSVAHGMPRPDDMPSWTEQLPRGQLLKLLEQMIATAQEGVRVSYRNIQAYEEWAKGDDK